MSWDLIVLDFKDARSDPESRIAIFADNWVSPVIGSGQTVRAKISDALPDVDWSDPLWGCLVGSDFALEFSLGAEDAISSFAIHARGNATPPVLTLMSATGWRMLDVSTTKWLHEASDPDEGRAKYQAYLDTVLETYTPTKTPSASKKTAGLLKRLLTR